MKTTLMSYESDVLWNLAFHSQSSIERAFKAYYAIRSFITYNGIFMGPVTILVMRVWRKEVEVEGVVRF